MIRETRVRVETVFLSIVLLFILVFPTYGASFFASSTFLSSDKNLSASEGWAGLIDGNEIKSQIVWKASSKTIMISL